MESYPTYNSGDSSPRSREIDFENPSPSWDDQPLQCHKVKLMVSYNGKIQPRPHDNHLTYVGGDTKILTIDRGINFSTFYSKLASLTSSDYASEVALASSGAFTCKYQLPGEDLDALISVSNDEDVEHMMQEYDRVYRGSLKPVRLRVFLSFERQNQNQNAAVLVPNVVAVDALPRNNQYGQGNADVLFGLDKVPVVQHVPCPTRVEVQQPVLQVKGAEPAAESELIHALNRLKICEQKQSAMYPEDHIVNDNNFVDNPYQRALARVNHPVPVQNPPQQQMQQFHQYHHQPQHAQQPVYMVQAPPQATHVHHAPGNPNGQIQQNKGYYQHVYSMPPTAPPVSGPVYTMPPPVVPVCAPVYTIPATMPQVSLPAAQVRPVMTAQLAHDGGPGRKAYYAAAPIGGVVSAAYPTVVTVAGAGDGKLVHKVVPSSAGLLERPLR